MVELTTKRAEEIGKSLTMTMQHEFPKLKDLQVTIDETGKGNLHYDDEHPYTEEEIMDRFRAILIVDKQG